MVQWNRNRDCFQRKDVSIIKKKLWPPDGRMLSNLIIVLAGMTFYFLLYRKQIVHLRIGHHGENFRTIFYFNNRKLCSF